MPNIRLGDTRDPGDTKSTSSRIIIILLPKFIKICLGNTYFAIHMLFTIEFMAIISENWLLFSVIYVMNDKGRSVYRHTLR